MSSTFYRNVTTERRTPSDRTLQNDENDDDDMSRNVNEKPVNSELATATAATTAQRTSSSENTLLQNEGHRIDSSVGDPNHPAAIDGDSREKPTNGAASAPNNINSNTTTTTTTKKPSTLADKLRARFPRPAPPSQPHSAADETQPEAPPQPVGFFHSDLSHVRLTIVRKWAINTLGLAVFILTVLSLYWAVLFRIQDKFHNLTVAVVSFDGTDPAYAVASPLLGQAVTSLAEAQAAMPKTLGYRVQPPSMYGNDAMAVRQAVYDEHVWAAVVVNANATFLLQQAVAEGNTSYDPLGAMQVVYVQARDENTYGNYITPMLNAFITEVQSEFGAQWVSSVLGNSSLDASTYERVPQALNPAVGASVFNLRPFGPPQATPAVSIGLIYLIIISFFTFSFYLPIHSMFLNPDGHPPLHFYHLILWRLFATTMAYLLLSLAYSLVSLAFQIPFSNTGPKPETMVVENADGFGRGTFVVYWMLNFVGMYALGLASENVTMVIGQPWTALWLIFWVITNVASAFYTLPIAPDFYRYGYAWPLHQVVEASRTILFDTHSRLGLNFGILAAWCAVNTAFFVPCALFMRWKAQKDHMREIAGGDRHRKIRYLMDG